MAESVLDEIEPPFSYVEIDGLVELLFDPPSAKVANQVIRNLTDAELTVSQSCSVQDSLQSSYFCRWSTVRLNAIRATVDVDFVVDLLCEVLQNDNAWSVRRAAIAALFRSNHRHHIAIASDDPHWRVRHALVDTFLEWGEDESERNGILALLTSDEREPRAEGIRIYLEHVWLGRDLPSDIPTASEPSEDCPFWDWYPQVVARRMENMGEVGRRNSIDWMPLLIGLDNEQVRKQAGNALSMHGEGRHFAAAINLLADPRADAAHSLRAVLGKLSLDRIQSIIDYLLATDQRSPTQTEWLLDQFDEQYSRPELEDFITHLSASIATEKTGVRRAFARIGLRSTEFIPVETFARFVETDSDPKVQGIGMAVLRKQKIAPADQSFAIDRVFDGNSLVRLEATDWLLESSPTAEFLTTAAKHRDSQVRKLVGKYLASHRDQSPELLRQLQADFHPYVRAAALTSERAKTLLADPSKETSWLVLSRAAKFEKTPLWEIAPQETWHQTLKPEPNNDPINLEFGSTECKVPFGDMGADVSRIGLSGHYGLPEEGFAEAVSTGVNLMFWEPYYQTMTNFFRRVPAVEKNRIHLIAGTYEANPKKIRTDLERALRLLKFERLSLFLLYWTHSWGRVTDEVVDELDKLKSEGKTAMYSLSTHNRPLAIDAIQRGWNPIMVRHSAGHRGAEETVFPVASKYRSTLISFNNTCYGRLLQPIGNSPGLSPADCYRYTLAQSAVSICLTAPATLEQLRENLQALVHPEISPEEMERMKRHGDLLYRQDKTFERLVRRL
jgi:aryl-alcohol dehydrogenase-like predicted oxidoreductase/HEAT repeat protein